MLTIYITTPDWDWVTSFILMGGIVAIALVTWAELLIVNWILQRKYF